MNPIAFLDEPCMMFRQAGSIPGSWCKNFVRPALVRPPLQMPRNICKRTKSDYKQFKKYPESEWNAVPWE